MAYKTPGVYVEEISTLPASVAQVETAIPVFIGHTAMAEDNGVAITEPKRIKSLAEYKKFYGEGVPVKGLTVSLDKNNNYTVKSVTKAPTDSFYYMYDSIRLFFDNGGGDCYIHSIGNYSTKPSKQLFKDGLKKVEKYDEPTLIVMPDAALLEADALHSLQVMVLQQCNKLQDRFGVFDLKEETDGSKWQESVDTFRKKIGINNLKYGAAYTPWVRAGFERHIPNSALTLKDGNTVVPLNKLPGNDTEIVTQAILKLSEAQNSATHVTGALDAIDAAHKPVQEKYRQYIADALADPKKATVDLVLKQYLEMLLPFSKWTKAGSDKLLKGNMLLEAQSTIDTVVEDALKTLINYHTTMAEGGAAALASAVGTTYNALKTDLGITHAGAADATLYDGATTAATKIANAQFKLDALFTEINGALESVKVASATAEKTADTTLYAVSTSYKAIVDGVRDQLNWLPPSGAIVGVYAAVDRNRGVWKAPANVSLSNVNALSYPIDHGDQERLNVDVTAGKSVNAIRSFSGKGLLVWGSRTLAGNDNEWRYVPVRRFYNMVEESLEKSTGWVVFEPNDSGTWIRVKAMIENYLTDLWRQGALAGAKPEQAFFVNVGLGTTMTAVDILEGRMIIEVGMAAVRPAEFVILRFSHKLQEA